MSEFKVGDIVRYDPTKSPAGCEFIVLNTPFGDGFLLKCIKADINFYEGYVDIFNPIGFILAEPIIEIPVNRFDLDI